MVQKYKCMNKTWPMGESAECVCPTWPGNNPRADMDAFSHMKSREGTGAMD